jgi:hypothetical protein
VAGQNWPQNWPQAIDALGWWPVALFWNKRLSGPRLLRLCPKPKAARSSYAIRRVRARTGAGHRTPNAHSGVAAAGTLGNEVLLGQWHEHQWG